MAGVRKRYSSFSTADSHQKPPQIYTPGRGREGGEGGGGGGHEGGEEGGGEGGRAPPNPWSWISKYDELSRAMETGKLLFGFHEVRTGGREGGREGGRGGGGIDKCSFSRLVIFHSIHTHVCCVVTPSSPQPFFFFLF
jgi:hypothetical protein